MTIFDLPTMSEAEAWVMIQATLERLPQLSRLYDEFLLGRLVRRRQMDNYLLLLLVQPNDEYAIGFWSLRPLQAVDTLRGAHSSNPKLSSVPSGP